MNSVIFNKSQKIFGKMTSHVTDDPKAELQFSATGDFGGGVFVTSTRVPGKRTFVPMTSVGTLEETEEAPKAKKSA